MRPIYASLITILLIGGVYGYIRFSQSVRRPPIEIAIDYAQGHYWLEIERTFECVPDPIFSPQSLRILFKGETVFETTESLSPDTPLTIEDVQGVEQGENELYLSANRAEGSSGLGVIKVTVFQNDIPIEMKMLTSEPGLSTVSGPLVFNVEHAIDARSEHTP